MNTPTSLQSFMEHQFMQNATPLCHEANCLEHFAFNSILQSNEVADTIVTYFRNQDYAIARDDRAKAGSPIGNLEVVKEHTLRVFMFFMNERTRVVIK